MRFVIATLVVCMAVCPPSGAQAPLEPTRAATTQTEVIPLHSPRWQLERQAEVTEYLGRRCLSLLDGRASLKDFEMTDGVIDLDMAGSGARGFYNIYFRTQGNGNGEEVYLRPHKTGLDDAQQYAPIFNGMAPWQIYNGPGFTRAVDIPKDVWFHVRLEIRGAQAKLYVNDMSEPSLVIDDLKSGVRTGGVGFEGRLHLERRNTSGRHPSRGSVMSPQCRGQPSQNGVCRRAWMASSGISNARYPSRKRPRSSGRTSPPNLLASS